MAIDIEVRDNHLHFDGINLFRGNASAVATKLKEETLKLVKIDVLPRDVVDAANDSPKALDALIQSGREGRIAHQVITVMEAATAETVRRGGTFSIEPGDGGPSLKVRAGSTEIATVEISSGATFAYLLLKPKWDANQQKNWKKIEDWEDDQWSLS